MTLRGHPIFSAFYGFMSTLFDKKMFGKQRTYLAQNFANLKVLEIGCGTGANFEYYPSSSKVIATEPDPHMFRRAQEHFNKLKRDNIELLQADAQNLPFGDAEFDAVLVTLVFCTIPNVPEALAEISRVLRPNAKMYFLEHVQAKSLGWQKVQDFANPLCNKLAGGCNLNRDTLSLFKEAGFVLEKTFFLKRSSPWLPFVNGTARKM